MKNIAFIFARGGSKGLPGKNTRPFYGKPLIAWSIEQALQINRIDRVIVSTDSVEIQEIALNFGAEVLFLRPMELAQDTTPEWLAWQHALNFLMSSTGELPDVFITLPTTSPLRKSVDIEHCIDKYLEGNADVVITTTNAHRSPYFNMVKRNIDDTFSLINSLDSQISRRQDAPEVFDMTTVCYVANPKFILNFKGIFDGRVKAVNVPPERAIDIDTLLDFKIAEFIKEQDSQ